MRTIPFKSVFDRVAVWHGLNPRKELPPDLVRTIVERINERVRQIILIWDWPEWKVTEQRAFRQIWNSTRQFFRVGANGQPDEFFYLVDQLYYRVNPDADADPPAGTIPGASVIAPNNEPYFIQIEVIDPYIDYDQTCRRAIGTVCGVFRTNPRGCGGNGSYPLKFHPSERGVDVCGGGPTVYICYMMPVPQYTILPYVVGKVYDRGVTVFDITTNECFQSRLTTNTMPPSTPDAWRRVPFLEKWEAFVTNGAFADSLVEFDQGGNQDVQVKIQLAAAAEARAQQSLEYEVNSLTAQGQVLKWSFCRPNGYWCDSQPWSGGDVIEISDVCEDDLGWVYPTVSTQAGVVWRYEWQVTILRSSDATTPDDISLESLNTRQWLPGSRINVVIGPSGSRVASEWLLVTGAYDSSDPGHIQPQDYNLTNNNKHWEQIQ